ncbi:SymE family type I addiction module toxin [Anaerocolumna xylanovorans]|uniref:Uncharacterized protein n=1 Tax=Anaerocolumna xylanovorans DSM 12503 TaxID=1121345 RepID=A0A1M7Y7T6_9FIRM|nr:hypothetical protein [Anaerocolumna xylanovorans]SHO48705.1 hypothetical protein SAMN02745217_01984 [Anaerocolumna xylanovorans DSM 12503]
MSTRTFKVFETHSLNLNTVAEESLSYNIYTHKLKVYSSSSNNSLPVPQIILQDKYVEQLGFSIDSSILVECHENKLITLKDDNFK